MDGRWIPPSLVNNYNEYGLVVFLDNVSGVQFVHRWLGMFLLIALTAIYYNFKDSLLVVARKRLLWFLIIVVVQAVIGVLTLLMAAPFAFAILHQFIAVLVVIIAVINVYSSRPGLPEPA